MRVAQHYCPDEVGKLLQTIEDLFGIMKDKYKDKREQLHEGEWIRLTCDLHRIQQRCEEITKILSAKLGGQLKLLESMNVEIQKIHSACPRRRNRRKFRKFWKNLWELYDWVSGRSSPNFTQ